MPPSEILKKVVSPSVRSPDTRSAKPARGGCGLNKIHGTFLSSACRRLQRVFDHSVDSHQVDSRLVIGNRIRIDETPGLRRRSAFIPDVKKRSRVCLA